ncbi:yjeF-related family protein [Ehrlichia chaffeensis str. Heartland]|uniref:Bifunctional NAD(P)H-hydrate repair enzyme n=1 Tax=Ehrlichia chaffeensis (strain ATCC CRL-10679 / Arkansas) TaxID=205920 RepID=Q2GG84_EHRCR|nr:YjeF family protein [Ehrlichia chaffeensis str. Arkansas]AHX03812.1 yjeF-related family protein [Ehrlichia chaffeensis str. Heartland]AHX05463.1 yjeF-related family protein [Ehrlichia chaffeensis str. Jax]AHX06451.1 yjeF-related family protein [Ehrlichia chaffeensis str. Liberty]AHX07501.1 yjeF-related family protein [Ehrlichia chaffeensis str. Osceola]AHX08776.1 yjeF-related family protein [Ehrlichia chaffeensis str. Saint Vincent]AHX09852.1 yjeF-related family protein [Ehrlichia chaffeen
MVILNGQQVVSFEKSCGVAIDELICRAGKAISDVIFKLFPKQPVAIISGPGNNGKDGIVTAKILKAHGWPVVLMLYNCTTDIDEDWVVPLTYDNVVNCQSCLVIDALFGIGLSRNIPENLSCIFHYINDSNNKVVVAVDIPSGINCDTGQVMGCAIRADVTVTFSVLKIGHVLFPGCDYSGKVHVVDIGIDIDDSKVVIRKNAPALWKHKMPKLEYTSNKYNRGYTLVCSVGNKSIGASKLVAMSALRVGSGIVSIACDSNAVAFYASCLTSIMYKLYDDVINDDRITSIVIGPGCGINDITKQRTMDILNKQNCVLDADSISVFSDSYEVLFSKIQHNVVMTPHEGEFKRIFPFLTGGKIEMAREAASLSKAVIVLKGPDTVIADPIGNVVVNNAPFSLATAGSGDVLSGIIGGLLSSGMSPFDAACCGVWIHTECARKYGIGLIADDIILEIPQVLKKLFC